MADLLAVLYRERKEAGLVHLAPVAHGRHHDYRIPLPRHHESIRQLGNLPPREHPVERNNIAAQASVEQSKRVASTDV